MELEEALELVLSAGFAPPGDMVLQLTDGSTCPCGETIWLLSHRGKHGYGFGPGFYVCGACRRVAKIGKPVYVPPERGYETAGNGGEVVVSVAFITGTVGASEPPAAIEAIARKLYADLVRIQQEGGPLAIFAIKLAGATYEPFNAEHGPTTRIEWDEAAAVPPAGGV